MKYISQHDRTIGALQSWAKSHKLVLASYFFWNSGHYMEKSQLGLLQRLLYQILLASPELIFEHFPGRLAKNVKEPWSLGELIEAFQNISLNENRNSALSAKYCFFIDGLDEYGGDGEQTVHCDDLVALIQRLANLANVKICISSRPWNSVT